MTTISRDSIRRELAPFKAHPDDQACDRIGLYISILIKWNSKISLTSITDPTGILRFHFGESLFAASMLPITDGRLADVGSGAGFPGLPLKILSPAIDLSLFEPNLKKAAFLSEVTRELELAGVTVLKERYEKTTDHGLVFRFITTRALGQYEPLVHWASKHLEVDGRLTLWLGEDDANAVARIKGWNWLNSYRIPGTERRVLLTGTPQAP
jgi:16S rRNA (guanine527-N7)-methyltransferase